MSWTFNAMAESLSLRRVTGRAAMQESISPYMPWASLGTHSLLTHVASRGVGQRHNTCADSTDIGWNDGLAGARIEPCGPFRPPRALLLRCLDQPGCRIDIAVAGFLGHHSEAATATVRLGHDADIVAAGREQICHFGVGQEVDLVSRAPRRDVIPLRAHGENRHADVGQRHRLVAGLEASFGKIIVEKEMA